MGAKAIVGAALLVLLLKAGIAPAAGQVAVLQVGDSANPASGDGTPIRIDYFDPSLPNQSSPVSATLIPSSAANALVLSGAQTEGQLTSSPDGKLVFGGYHAPAGTRFIDASTSLLAPRAIGTVSGSTYTLAASFGSDYLSGKDFSSGNLGAAAGDGNGHFWGAGTEQGTILAGDGSNNVVIQSTLFNTRVVSVVNGNLYFSSLRSTKGIYSLGPAGSATVPITPTLIFATGTRSVPTDFAFNADNTIAYLTDDRPPTDQPPHDGAGVERFDKIGGVWTLSYTLQVDAAGTTPLLGLGVDWSGVEPIVYASTDEPNSSRVLRWTDTGAGALPTTLATATPGTAFRGVEFVPEPGSIGFVVGSVLLSIRRRR